MTSLDPTAAVAVGLLGSAHCVGMCGGFVALLGAGSDRAVAPRQAAYFLGKTLTYAVFGAFAGAAGASLAGLFGSVGGAVALGLGGLMVVVGVGLCGAAWGHTPRVAARVAQRLGPAVGRLVADGSTPALVALGALGALNGLLPCGLVYGMLAVAAGTGSALGGALTMGAFGVATLPALAAAGVLGARMRPQRRVWMQRAAGMLVVAMGLLTVARGAHALTADPYAGHRGHAAAFCGV